MVMEGEKRMDGAEGGNRDEDFTLRLASFS